MQIGSYTESQIKVRVVWGGPTHSRELSSGGLQQLYFQGSHAANMAIGMYENFKAYSNGAPKNNY